MVRQKTAKGRTLPKAAVCETTMKGECCQKMAVCKGTAKWCAERLRKGARGDCEKVREKTAKRRTLPKAAVCGCKKRMLPKAAVRGGDYEK